MIPAPQPNNSPQGLQTLNDFIGGTGQDFVRQLWLSTHPFVDVELIITGFSGSTQVDSLLLAFQSLNITTTLPGLKSSLLSSGSLQSGFL